MTDTLTKDQRSERMSRVRHRDTEPELIVRRYLHAAKLRYRLHRRIEGARPDLVFSALRTVVFVHGCIWHQHQDTGCKLARMPKSRLDFWRPKLEGNRARDARQRASLEASGWRVCVIWECEVKNQQKLAELLRELIVQQPNLKAASLVKTPMGNRSQAQKVSTTRPPAAYTIRAE